MFDFVSVLFFILKKFLKGMKVFRFWRKSSEQKNTHALCGRPVTKKRISKGQSPTDCRRFPLVSTVFPL